MKEKNYFKNLRASEAIYITRSVHHWCGDTAIQSIEGQIYTFSAFKWVPNSFLRNVAGAIFSSFFALKIPKSRLYLAGSSTSLLILNIKKYIFRHKFITIQYVKSDYYNRENHKGFNGKFLDILAKIVDGVIVPGEMVRGEIRDRFNFPVEINYHYPKTDNFYKIKANPSTEDVIIIGIKSRFRKGTDIVLEVAKKMPQKMFYLLGYTKHLPKKFVKELKKQKNIILTGFADPRKYIPKCTYFLLPGRYDAGPIALTEAMASGLIPIISDKLGGQDLAFEADNNLVVKSMNPNKYIDILNYLNNLHQKERDKLSNKCKKIALRHTRKKGQRDFNVKFNKILKIVLNKE